LNDRFDEVVNKKPSIWFVYNDELTIRSKIYFPESLIEFRDIMYNRYVIVLYEGMPEHYTSVDKLEYGNILFHVIDENKYYLLFIISEMEVVMRAPLQVYD